MNGQGQMGVQRNPLSESLQDWDWQWHDFSCCCVSVSQTQTQSNTHTHVQSVVEEVGNSEYHSVKILCYK